jgi:hypothetical protein
MFDSLLETFIHYGTDAERLAFTPAPPEISGTPIKILYIWEVSDAVVPTFYMYTTTWLGPFTASGSSGNEISPFLLMGA